ncbi:MAG: hypothetical protein JWM57_438, partial [Phycisphaerales bacterium]|nr:hypothetical protein [Phycisphaerales bacterium]
NSKHQAGVQSEVRLIILTFKSPRMHIGFRCNGVVPQSI